MRKQPSKVSSASEVALTLLLVLFACGIEPSPTLADRLAAKQEAAQAQVPQVAPEPEPEPEPVAPSMRGHVLGAPAPPDLAPGTKSVDLGGGVEGLVSEGVFVAYVVKEVKRQDCDGDGWTLIVFPGSVERGCFGPTSIHTMSPTEGFAIVAGPSILAKVSEKMNALPNIAFDWRTSPWIGDNVDIRSVRYTVQSFDCQLLEARYKVENIGDRTMTAIPRLAIKDSKGRIFDPSTSKSLQRAAELEVPWLLSELQPGLPVGQVAAFEVPTDALKSVFYIRVAESVEMPFICP